VLAWNFRRTLDNDYLLLVGLASIFVAAIDLLHALTYKGMGVFAGLDANPPTQLWLVSRYLQSAILVAAPLLMGRRIRGSTVTLTYTTVTVALAVAVYSGIFPLAYVEGTGLTPFKMVSEVVIALALSAALVLLQRRRQSFDPKLLRLLSWSIVLGIVAEVAFMSYIGVYDAANLVGHLLRLVSTYLLYAAMVETGLTKPYTLLFRNLKRSQEALQQERNFVAAVLDRAGTLMMVLDAEGRIVRFNRACQELTGYGAAEAIGQIYWDLLLGEGEREAALSRASQVLSCGPSGEVERKVVTRSSEQRLVLWTNVTLANDEDGAKFIVCTGVDVTERRRVERELREREEHLRMMVESVQTGMLLIDRKTQLVVNANPTAAEMIGLPAHSIAGRPCTEFFRCALEGDRCPMDCGANVQASTEPLLITAGGRLLPVHRKASAVVTDGREQLLESFMDMTERKRLEEELRALSLVDELSGLYNRRGFLTLAQKEIDLSIRLGRGLVLLFIDVDGMKEINATWGHTEGDQALAAAAGVLRESFSETGLIARIGGDEFVVLAPEFVGLDGPLLANRLARHLETFNCLVRRNYELRLSSGFARFNPEQPCSVHELLDQADSILYARRRRQTISGQRSAQ